MTETNDLGLRRIRRALISVSDKSGIIDLARALTKFEVEIISTGGTARTLRDAGIPVRDVSDVTGFPEMMDGRIKTLHPLIHGGLLALRDNPEHVKAMNEHGITPIDMVIVNLYPFRETIVRPNVTQAEAIEQIDIGGPAMIRSAAKNYQDVAVVVLTADYPRIVHELESQDGSLSLKTRSELARVAFGQTAVYDGIVTAYLSGVFQRESNEGGGISAGTFGISSDGHPTSSSDNGIDSMSIETFRGGLPESASWSIRRTANLRYGENPHQVAALYRTGSKGVANAEILSGKEMSFNNFVDAEAAWQLVCDFEQTACAIIKHTNPAGVALSPNPEEAYRKALATDPVSAFGGIVAFNCPVDEPAARAVTEIFTEVLIAPDYDKEALEILKAKKNLRVLRAWPEERTPSVEYKQITGGMLVQTRDTHVLSKADLKVVSKRQPTDDEIEALVFAWTVCKHTKSNAIVYARAGQTVGMGAGQMSRVDSVKLGAMRAQLPIAGSVLASDAFFPFRDGIDEAAKHGITAVIQPGGSIKDTEAIAAADEHNLAMVFTGIRHFKH
ncbi:MAG TPA: bifunctional phosphoribosylaminoimidazolecarboxamide formyltransferase/IMP cyclohydrolase [Pyrinomonadaceae bacterium]|jgi:phosphoribosylaminoimidazolecarboxamide formyltransferase/IMP cyclohydrolase|nr:bifunctional phosphoribosylaminoimidazolecarboxamide formyltransferase/IMP cyclohydrolase [Pyrinomonadaceae bacterium]